MLNQFEIIEKLGEGSYSSVYKVKRKVDRKIYALKKVNIPLLNDKERENSLNEVRIIASVRHPNIVGYKECFYDTENKVLCVIMEHADGGDLLQKVRQCRDYKTLMPESQIWSIMIQTISALKALHDNKIVHRDMKSANILLCSDGRVKLADFNVSKILKNNMIKTQIGTPFYASPEIWNYIPYDYKADMWSLGCIVYEMCCLRTPFLGKDMEQICRQVCKGVYKKIPSVYSKDLWNVIQMLLQVQPSMRPNCERLLLYPPIQNHLKSQTLNLLENSYELLSTIEWSKKKNTDNVKTRKNSNNQRVHTEEVFSVRLPPPHYTPVSLSISEPKRVDPTQSSRIEQYPSNVQSRSLDIQFESPRSKTINTIQDDELPQPFPRDRQKLKLRLRQLKQLSDQNSIQLRTDSSRNNRLQQSVTPQKIVNTSRNHELKDKYLSSLVGDRNKTLDSRIEYHSVDVNNMPVKGKLQSKQIYDLLQGNPLLPSKQHIQNPNKRHMRNDTINNIHVKQNIDEMRSIKNQIQDINRIIQQQSSRRENYIKILRR